MNDWSTKKLGYGLMRLPKNEEKQIILDETCKLVDRYLEAGFTYFDTAYVYNGSEEAFRKAVAQRYPRESYTITSKLAAWQLSDAFRPKDMFETSLKRCGVEYFDYYLLHSLQESHGTIYEDNGCFDFVKQMREEGKIRHIGFSFHGSPQLLEKLLSAHPEMEFVQLQINYVDWDNDLIASRLNYEIARKYGKDIIIMEPVKGGILANIRPDARKVLDEIDPDATSASIALRYAASLPGVKMVLSGMNATSQLEDNIKTFTDFVPFTDEQMDTVLRAGHVILSAPTVPCTACRYCVDGCPMSIRIPDIFQRYNMLLTFGEHFRPHGMYRDLINAGSGRAGDCIACGQCENACPQHISIIEELKKASALLDL